MDSYEYEASQLANLSTFDGRTWIMTTQFANTDDFLDRVEAELGLMATMANPLIDPLMEPLTPRHLLRSRLMPRLLWCPPLMIMTWTLQQIPMQAPSHAAQFFPCQQETLPTGP
jgi:hypothetical protein